MWPGSTARARPTRPAKGLTRPAVPGLPVHLTQPIAPGLSTPLVEASSFLPTLERARSEGYVPLDPDGDEVALLPGEPVAQRRLAALVVRARVVRREARDDLTEMSPARAA